MKKRKVIWYILLGVNLVLLLLTGVQYGRRLKLQQGIAEKVIRFHVLANSDTLEDQALKIKVRDAVGEKLGVLLEKAGSRKESEAVIREQMEVIEKTAGQTVAAEGYDYKVKVSLRETDFPVKQYGSFRFPAGKYEALEIEIGEGAGKNWWCVMYPNMCFSGSVYEIVDEEAEESLRRTLSPGEYEKVLASGEYRVQFQYLTFLNEYLR